MGRWSNWVRNARSGVRDDLGPMNFRSGWEPNVARCLNRAVDEGWIKLWKYEAMKFRFPDREFKNGKKMRRKAYIPDFEVHLNDGRIMYYEVKGWVNADAKRKQRLMAEFYPEVMVITIGPDEYRDLERGWSGEVNWESARTRQSESIEL